MKLGNVCGMVLLSLWFTVGATAAAGEGEEYRVITLMNDAVFRGVVVSSDSEVLVVRTASGDHRIPLMDIVGIQTIDRQTYVREEGLLLLYFPIRADPGLAEKAKEVDEFVMQTLQGQLIMTILPTDLAQPEQDAITSCSSRDCRIETSSKLDLTIIDGTLAGEGELNTLTFRRFDPGVEEPLEVSWQVGNPATERYKLAHAARRLVKELEAPTALTKGDSESRDETSSPDTDEPPSTREGDQKEAISLHMETSSPGQVDLDIAHLRRLDLIPVPGASALFSDGDWKSSVVAGGVVVALTGLTVYYVGDMRRLGLEGGLPVPWPYEDRAVKDPAFLSGVGIVTYLTTTWISNQVVRKVRLRRKGR